MTDDTTGASRRYWDEWNTTWRFRDELDPFMQAQAELASSVARGAALRDARILDVGCGTGWLGHQLRELGTVWGTDLSPAAIAEGSRKYPELRLMCEDFMTAQLPAPFDFVISADALVHMHDHAAGIARMASLLRPGGTLLLMTQNPFVWQRRSKIRHVPTALPHWSPGDWPSLPMIRGLLRDAFAIDRVTSLDPGGDSGLLWWVENRYVRGAAGRLLGRARWRSLLEAGLLGRELVIVATRRVSDARDV